jgi:hypothetical protein
MPPFYNQESMRVRLAGLSAYGFGKDMPKPWVKESEDLPLPGNPIAPALAGIRFFHDKIASFCLDDDDLLPLLYEVTARDGVQDMPFDIHFARRAKD